MNTNLLKIFAGYAITTSDLTEDVKVQLLNYVQEGSEYQVKAFLLDGDIMKEPNDVVCEGIIDDRFEISDLPSKVEVFKIEWAELLSS